MRNFKSFVTESPKRFSVADFKLALASNKDVLHGMSNEQFTKVIERTCPVLNAALDAGEIANPVFVNLKSDVNRIVEAALKRPEWLINAVWRENSQKSGFTLYDLDNGIPYANHIEGKLKRALAAQKKAESVGDKTYLKWIIPQLQELLPFTSAFLSLKDKVVKKVAKTDAEKAEMKQRYIAPMAKMESGKQVAAVLKKLTDALKGDYEADVLKFYIKQAEEFVAIPTAEEQRKKMRGYDVGAVLDSSAGYHKPYTLVKNYKSIFAKKAKKDADEMQESFIYKNSLKLVSILERKDIALTHEPKILDATAGHGVFEGNIRIDFADKSGFTVRNKIVWKRSIYGKVFNQFPTTFHDVVLPNGKSMPMPSEERMNDVFTKG